MLQYDGAIRIDDKADIEEPIGPILVTRLGLRHDESAPAAREPPDTVGLRTRNINGAGPRELGVVDVENLVVEPLQCAFWNGNEADGNVEAGQPKRRLDQAFEMLQVFGDVIAATDAPKGRDQPDCGIGFDHDYSRSGVGLGRRMSGQGALGYPLASRRYEVLDPRICSISWLTASISAIPFTQRRVLRAR